MTEHSPEHPESPEIIVRSQDDPDTRVRLFGRYFPDEHGTGFAVELCADGLRARLDSVETWVWDHEYLHDFLARLAADFRGWYGERTWNTNHLTLRAVFRSGGHVGLTWTLMSRTTQEDSWRASATTWLEAGEQMTALAADVREFLMLERGARD